MNPRTTSEPSTYTTSKLLASIQRIGRRAVNKRNKYPPSEICNLQLTSAQLAQCPNRLNMCRVGTLFVCTTDIYALHDRLPLWMMLAARIRSRILRPAMNCTMYNPSQWHGFVPLSWAHWANACPWYLVICLWTRSPLRTFLVRKHLCGTGVSYTYT